MVALVSAEQHHEVLDSGIVVEREGLPYIIRFNLPRTDESALDKQ